MGDPKKIEMVEEWTSNVVDINNKNLLTTTPASSSLPTHTIEHKKFFDFELKKFTTFNDDVNAFLKSVVQYYIICFHSRLPCSV